MIRLVTAVGLLMLTGCGGGVALPLLGLGAPPTPAARWAVSGDVWARWLAETRIAAELPTATPTPWNALTTTP